MKKILQYSLVTLSLSMVGMLLVSNTYADTMPYNNKLQDGFYLGAELGYDSYGVEEKTNYIPGITAFSTSFGDRRLQSNPEVSVSGFSRGLLAGYGRYFYDAFYIGTEVFGNWANINQNWGSGLLQNLPPEGSSTFGAYVDYNLVNLHFTAKSNYGLSLLPGIKLGKSSLIYTRLGCNWSQVSGKSALNAKQVGIMFGGYSDEKITTLHGFNYGIGLENAIAYHFSLRGEYNHTNYGSFTTHLITTKWTVSDNQFMMALIYHLV